MSFDLPAGFIVSKEKYKLPNGQGFKNKANYVSSEGGVISLFEVHRDPDEFFTFYDKLNDDIANITDGFSLQEKCKLSVGEFIFPTYVIKCAGEKLFFTVQVFVNCGDCLACFMINLPSFTTCAKELKSNKLFSQLIKLLRSVE